MNACAANCDCVTVGPRQNFSGDCGGRARAQTGDEAGLQDRQGDARRAVAEQNQPNDVWQVMVGTVAKEAAVQFAGEVGPRTAQPTDFDMKLAAVCIDMQEPGCKRPTISVEAASERALSRAIHKFRGVELTNADEPRQLIGRSSRPNKLDS